MKFCNLIQRDVDKILREAVFTADQEAIFRQLIRAQYNDVGIMMNLNMSNARYYRIKKEIYGKIERILGEK